MEVIARAVVNHVRVTSPEGMPGLLPDDIARYSDVESEHVPAPGSHVSAPHEAHGKYLQAPVLDYTVGTRITPRISKELESLGEHKVLVSHEQPEFEPHMVRLMENPGHGLDWMSQLGSSYVKGNLLDTVHRGGATAPTHGTAPLPGLAEGIDFGRPPKGTAGY